MSLAAKAPSTAPAAPMGCPLCTVPAGVVWEDDAWWVIRVEDVDFPAFYRVISKVHVAEWTDLSASAQVHAMCLVSAVERALRTGLQPTKVNLASLGNVVPHLHWHVVARFEWDSHFPAPIWAAASRIVEGGALARLPVPLNQLDARVREHLDSLRSDPASSPEVPH